MNQGLYEIICSGNENNLDEHQLVKKFYDGSMTIQSEISLLKDFNIHMGSGYYRTATIDFMDYLVPFVNNSIFYDDFESRPAVSWYVKNVDYSPQSAIYWTTEYLPQYRGTEKHPPRICICSNYQIQEEVTVRVGYIARGWWKENSIITKCLELANKYYQDHWTKYGTYNFKFYNASDTQYQISLSDVQTGKIDAFVYINKSDWSVFGSADFE